MKSPPSLNPNALYVAFKLQERVRIPELNCIGMVIAIYFSETGTQYSVRYFMHGKPEQCYFYLFELEPMEPRS